MKKQKEENNYIMFNNKNKLRELENFYVNATFDNLNELVELKKNEIVQKIEKIQEENENSEQFKTNPYLISTYFFKSINPLSSKIPAYNAERLSIVWDLYMYLIEQVNINLATFQPSLSHFAKFAGITLNTLNAYKNSGDEDMITVCEKIYDECFNGNMSLAQNKIFNERTTLSRMKIENKVVEQTQPQVKVNVNTKVNLDEINKRLEELKKFNVKVVELDKKRKK